MNYSFFFAALLASATLFAQPRREPAKPLPRRPVAAPAPAKPVTPKDKPPLYAPGRAVSIGNPALVFLDYAPESLKPRVNEYLAPVNTDSVKAVLRVAQLANWPEGINTKEKFAARAAEVQQYKGYQLLRYVDDNRKTAIALVWIPRSENGHMATDMIPAGAEGIYMAVDDNVIKMRVTGKKPRPAAPAPVVKGLTRDFSIRVQNLEMRVVHRMDAAGLERAKSALTGNGKFTEAEFNEMAARADIRNYPAGLSSIRKLVESPSFHAKGYVQGTFLLPFNGVAEWTHLVWVPMADNAELREEFKDGKDLFYFMNASVNPFDKQPATYTWPAADVAEMKQRHNKAIAETIPKDIIHGSFEAAYKPLRSAGYTEAEAGRIMQLCTVPYAPEGLEYQYWYGRYTEIEKLKAYRIAEFENGYGTARMYWVPKEENAAAPPDLVPPTDEGAFVMAFVRRRSGDEDKSLTTRSNANKPTWEYYPGLYRFYAKGGTDAQIAEMGRKQTTASTASSSGGGSLGPTSATTNSGGISHSTADMSQFTRNASQGSIMLYYGWNGKPASAYIYELRGSALKNKQLVADALVKQTSQSGGSFIGFEHFPGDCNGARNYIRRKAGSGIASTCSGSYNVD